MPFTGIDSVETQYKMSVAAKICNMGIMVAIIVIERREGEMRRK
jgi:hypothetical protein